MAVLIQVTLVARLPLPGGGPALLVLVVAVVALADGPATGMLAGFIGGVLADLTPPSDHTLGQSALVLVLVAEGVGLFARRPSGLLRPVLLIAAATLISGVGAAAVGTVLGRPVGSLGGLVAGASAAAGYNVALAPALLLLRSLRSVALSSDWDRHRHQLTSSGGGRRRRTPFGGSAAAGGLQ